MDIERERVVWKTEYRGEREVQFRGAIPRSRCAVGLSIGPNRVYRITSMGRVDVMCARLMWTAHGTLNVGLMVDNHLFPELERKDR